MFSGLFLQIAFSPGNFLPFGPVRKFRIRNLSTGCFFVCLRGIFLLILSPESRNSRSLLQLVCLLVLGFSLFHNMVHPFLVDKSITLMVIFFSLGP